LRQAEEACAQSRECYAFNFESKKSLSSLHTTGDIVEVRFFSPGTHIETPKDADKQQFHKHRYAEGLEKTYVYLKECIIST
jgi:hypothetical protein